MIHVLMGDVLLVGYGTVEEEVGRKLFMLHHHFITCLQGYVFAIPFRIQIHVRFHDIHSFDVLLIRIDRLDLSSIFRIIKQKLK